MTDNLDEKAVKEVLKKIIENNNTIPYKAKAEIKAIIEMEHNPDNAFIVVADWMRNHSTISFLGLWEQIHNPNFKPIEFDRFKAESGDNAFTLTPQQWIKTTDAIGIISKSGRYGGTYAHTDISKIKLFDLFRNGRGIFAEESYHKRMKK